MTVLALIGAKGLYMLYGWLASAIVASWLSARKGWGEKAGLASGLLLPGISVIAWLVWPARADSLWRRDGPVTLPRRPAARGEPVQRSRKAVAAVVLGVLGLLAVPVVCATAAIVVGVLALRELRENSELQGEGMARAGIALGVTGLVLALGFALLLAVS
jgi:hypothetical protein